jgi:hypothetical protein
MNNCLRTYGYKDIDLAIKRLNNKNDYCPLKKNIPIVELQELLKVRLLTMSPSLHDVVVEMELKFRKEVADTAAAKQLLLLAQEKSCDASVDKDKATMATKPKGKRRGKIIYKDGTDLAAYYFDWEMDLSDLDNEGERTYDDNDPGCWYRGHIVGPRWTSQNKLVYECKFDTPRQHLHEFTSGNVTKLIKSFEENKHDCGWTTQSTLPHVINLQRDMSVRRFFERHELPKNHNPEDGLLGAYVNGTISEIRELNSSFEYKIFYEAPISSEMWSNLDVTRCYRATYTLTATYRIVPPSLTIPGTPNADVQDMNDDMNKQQIPGTVEQLIVAIVDKEAAKVKEVDENRGEGGERDTSPTELGSKGVNNEASVATPTGMDAPPLIDDMNKLQLPGTVDKSENKIEIPEQLRVANVDKEAAKVNNEAPEATSAGMDAPPLKTIKKKSLKLIKKKPSKNFVVTGPTTKYTKEQKDLRARCFPCLQCGDPADGAHQCGFCFCHVHVFCTDPFPGTSEGFGQLRICPACRKSHGANGLLANNSTAPTVPRLPTPPSTSPAEESMSDKASDSEMTSWIEKGIAVPLGTTKPKKRKHVDERPDVLSSENPETSGGKEIMGISQAPRSETTGYEPSSMTPHAHKGGSEAVDNEEVTNEEDVETKATKVKTKKRKVSKNTTTRAVGECLVPVHTPENNGVVGSKVPKSTKEKKRRLVDQFLKAKKVLKKAIIDTNLEPSKNKSAKMKLKRLVRQFLKDEKAVTGDCRDIMLQIENQDAPDHKQLDVTAPNNTEDGSKDYVWFWDTKKNDWVAKKKISKPRRKYLKNHKQKNWILGMRRLWKTPQKDLLIEKISIRRNEMNTVCKFHIPNINM